MNSREEREYWESLGVSFRKYKERWNSQYKHALNRYIEKATDTEVQYLTFIFELKDSSELSNLIEDIETGLPVFCALEFCRDKKKFIKEYCSKFDNTFETVEKENPFLAVLKIYKNWPESLKKFLIYYVWRQTKTELVCIPDTNIEKEHFNKLKVKRCDGTPNRSRAAGHDVPSLCNSFFIRNPKVSFACNLPVTKLPNVF